MTRVKRQNRSKDLGGGSGSGRETAAHTGQLSPESPPRGQRSRAEGNAGDRKAAAPRGTLAGAADRPVKGQLRAGRETGEN